VYEGEHLDVEVRPWEKITNKILTIYYGPVSSLRVLKDSSDADGEQIVLLTRIAYEKGPTKKNQEELQLDKSEMARLLSKIRTHAHDPESCFTTLGFFHRLALQCWFEKRGCWSLPPYKALPIVRKEDCLFAQCLEEIASGAEIGRKVIAGERAYSILWGL
jgi:hypothetical protein